MAVVGGNERFLGSFDDAAQAVTIAGQCRALLAGLQKRNPFLRGWSIQTRNFDNPHSVNGRWQTDTQYAIVAIPPETQEGEEVPVASSFAEAWAAAQQQSVRDDRLSRARQTAAHDKAMRLLEARRLLEAPEAANVQEGE